ncbi:DUF6458 family protein [Paramicrobacterium chengjingii]|uniref:DUF6458 domain-containing protein n=1 Tax=Paramicrobacterium chengjingii TaxID=2769067 RepID=A0ABX6YLP6_9MICO|nr:DUF6458 family protein [Microbacterium chengjingii]QPZ39759.1 hypothetical protein HCR76_06900 [Microbacterium chengjingii]
MSIGAGIFLLAIGAILTFAVNIEVQFVDLDMIGYILMAAGVLVVVLGIVLAFRKRRTVVTRQQGVDRRTGQRYDTTEHGDNGSAL